MRAAAIEHAAEPVAGTITEAVSIVSGGGIRNRGRAAGVKEAEIEGLRIVSMFQASLKRLAAFGGRLAIDWRCSAPSAMPFSSTK